MAIEGFRGGGRRLGFALPRRCVGQRAFFGRGFRRQRLACGWARRCPLLLDRSVEPLGVGLRPNAEFALQGIAAELILLQRQRRLALRGVDLHERAVRDLPQGIDARAAGAQRRRLVVRAARHVPIDQPCQRLTRQVAQALPFHQQPFVERRIAEIEAVQQIAAIERRRAREALDRALADQLLELRHIDRNRCPLQAQEVTIGEERRRLHAIERFSQLEDGLLQAVPRLTVAAVTPEQPGQLVARSRLAGWDCQNGEQRALLASGYVDLPPGGASLEPTEQNELQGSHRRRARLGSRHPPNAILLA